jgi:hypothetical protein
MLATHVTRQLIPKTRFTRGRVRELKNAHNSVTVQIRTYVYVNFFLSQTPRKSPPAVMSTSRETPCIYTNNTRNVTKQTMHRTTQKIHRTTQKLGRVRTVPRLCGY